MTTMADRTASVELPFNLTTDEARESIAAELKSIPAKDWRNIDQAMEFLVDHVVWAEDDELERILRSAVCIRTLDPSLSLGIAIHIAIIWERG